MTDEKIEPDEVQASIEEQPTLAIFALDETELKELKEELSEMIELIEEKDTEENKCE